MSAYRKMEKNPNSPPPSQAQPTVDLFEPVSFEWICHQINKLYLRDPDATYGSKDQRLGIRRQKRHLSQQLLFSMQAFLMKLSYKETVEGPAPRFLEERAHSVLEILLAWYYQFPYDAEVASMNNFNFKMFARICYPHLTDILGAQILGRILEINQHLTPLQQQGFLYNLTFALHRVSLLTEPIFHRVVDTVATHSSTLIFGNFMHLLLPYENYYDHSSMPISEEYELLLRKQLEKFVAHLPISDTLKTHIVECGDISEHLIKDISPETLVCMYRESLKYLLPQKILTNIIFALKSSLRLLALLTNLTPEEFVVLYSFHEKIMQSLPAKTVAVTILSDRKILRLWLPYIEDKELQFVKPAPSICWVFLLITRAIIEEEENNKAIREKIREAERKANARDADNLSIICSSMWNFFLIHKFWEFMSDADFTSCIMLSSTFGRIPALAIWELMNGADAPSMSVRFMSGLVPCVISGVIGSYVLRAVSVKLFPH